MKTHTDVAFKAYAKTMQLAGPCCESLNFANLQVFVITCKYVNGNILAI